MSINLPTSLCIARILIVLLLFLASSGCSGNGSDLATDNALTDTDNTTITAQTCWPVALPADSSQPWESLDDNGIVMPSRAEASKTASAITADGEFFAGIERYDEAGDVFANGEASRVASGAPDGGGLSWAQYRFTMGGTEPGCISADVNLLPRGDSSPSEYWLGLSHYSIEAWEWRGPFTDSHVRVSCGADVAAGESYLSSLGNLFVSVVAFDGSSFDVVGIGVEAYDEFDTTAPPSPTGITATPRAGALELTWNDVLAGDLAGYNIYSRDGAFTAADSPGVVSLGYLSGSTRGLLSGLTGETFIRLSAVDLSGNESTLSEMVSGTPLAGEQPPLVVTVDSVSGMIGDAITLTVDGANTYDYDLDGNGIYEITGSSTTSQNVSTSAAGIIRPAVRGSSAAGAVALGAVSLLVAANARPIAQGYVDPSSGFAPLAVTFTSLSSDFDGTIVKWAWDYDGDKTYDFVTTDEGSKNPPPYIYTDPGIYNAKFRAWDNDDAWDVDTVTIHVYDNLPPMAVIAASCTEGAPPLHVDFDAAGSYDLDGNIVQYEWDLNGNGTFETDTGAVSQASEDYTAPGAYEVGLRITDDNGATATTTQLVTTQGWLRRTIHSTDDSGNFNSLAIIDGYPAICFFQNTANQLMYVRAVDPYGGDIPWNVEVVAGVGAVDVYTSLAEINGAPAIAYYDDVNQELHYTRAQNSTGLATTWDDVTVDTNGDAGMYCDMEAVGGNPAISYFEAGTEELRYARAQNATGIGTTWDTVTVRAAGATYGYGIYTDLEVVMNNPAITYSDSDEYSQLYSRAVSSTGTSGGWTHQTVENSDGAYGQLEVADGRPVAAYRGFLSYLVFSRAPNGSGTGAVWDDIDLDTDLWTGYHNSLAIIDGCPAVCWLDVDDETLEYLRSSTLDGGHVQAWTQRITVDTVGPMFATDKYQQGMIDINGRPAIAYRDNNNDDLKFAIMF